MTASQRGERVVERRGHSLPRRHAPSRDRPASKPARSSSASSIGPVRVTDLPGATRPTRRARRRSTARRLARGGWTLHPADVDAREHAEVRGPEHGAGAEHEVAGLHVATGAAGRDRPRVADCCTSTPSSPSRSVRSTMTMASAPSGIGAPVMMRIASPSPTGIVGAWPGGELPDHAEADRRVGRRGTAVSPARTA